VASAFRRKKFEGGDALGFTALFLQGVFVELFVILVDQHV
jgi:hypothetical protein